MWALTGKVKKDSVPVTCRGWSLSGFKIPEPPNALPETPIWGPQRPPHTHRRTNPQSLTLLFGGLNVCVRNARCGRAGFRPFSPRGLPRRADRRVPGPPRPGPPQRPRPAARRHTSRAFSWPTSPEAACLARPLSSSPSPFTWLWEAIR